MNITDCIIVTDTNIITDLHIANLLEHFLKLDNVFICDMVLNDEINDLTCEAKALKFAKVINSTAEELIEVAEISKIETALSTYDILNFVLAKNHDGIIATGDRRLKNFAEDNKVKVIRTIRIIELLAENNIISEKDELDSYVLLLNDDKTRLPISELEKKIKEISSVAC